MSTYSNKQSLVILFLILLLVAVVGFWAVEKANTSSNHASQFQGELEKGQIQWKIITTWPKNLPGLGQGPETFARYLDEMSGGKLSARVYGAGEIVPALDVFDAVSLGVAEVGHGASYYWKGKIPASVFFTAIPFGMTAQEMNGWFHYGGGLEIWEEVYAPFNVTPLAGGSTGVQMAGWFNREINSVEDVKGLKMRIPGMAGEVFTAIGGTTVQIAGGELYTSLQTGVIDATEWVGPYNDLALGLHEIAKYYYYPGWHEPGAMLEFIVNKDALKKLSPELRAIVKHAARAANQDMLDEFTARNNDAVVNLVENHGVQVRRLPDDVLLALYSASQVVMQELIEKDPMAAKVHRSFSDFYDGVRQYHHISEQAYINARDKVIDASNIPKD